MQAAAERQQFRTWMLDKLQNTPVEKSRDTMGQYMHEMIRSKTHHSDKAAKITGMGLEQYHGNVHLTDEYVYMMGDIGAFQSKCKETVFTLMCAQGLSLGTSSDSASTISSNDNFQNESAIWAGEPRPEMAAAMETLLAPPSTYDIDALVRKLEASKAELNKSRLELGMLRSSVVPAVT